MNKTLYHLLKLGEHERGQVVMTKFMTEGEATEDNTRSAGFVKWVPDHEIEREQKKLKS